MKDINLPPFYIGQRVAARISHSQGLFKKGDEFIVQDIMPTGCNCNGDWVVDIGIKSPYRNYKCAKCGRKNMPLNRNNCLLKHKLFIPIEQTFQSISLEKVLENETKLISVN